MPWITLIEFILDLSRRLVPDAVLPPAFMQAYIPVGEGTPQCKCDFHGSVFGELSRIAELIERLCFKIND